MLIETQADYTDAALPQSVKDILAARPANDAAAATVAQKTADEAITKSAFTNVTSLTDVQLAGWRAARAAVMAGVRDANVLFVGDSHFAGLGVSSGVSSISNSLYLSAPAMFAKALAASGVPVSYNSMWCDNNFGTASYSTYANPNFSIVGSVVVDTFSQAIAGRGWRFTGAGTLTFAAPEPFDTIEIWHKQLVTGGVTNVVVNKSGGATLGTLVGSTTGVDKVAKTTYSTPLGAGIVNLIALVASSTVIYGIVCRNSTRKAVHVHNMGASGSDIFFYGGQTAAPWLPFNFVPQVPKDLLFFGCCINDAQNNGTLASNPSYLPRLRAFLSQLDAKTVVIAPAPVETSTNAYIRGDAYKQVYRAEAMARGFGYIDLAPKFVDWATSNAAGMQYDTIHPNAVGYQFMAQQIFNEFSR